MQLQLITVAMMSVIADETTAVAATTATRTGVMITATKAMMAAVTIVQWQYQWQLQ